MRDTLPVLLSFYALSNGKDTLAYGQLTRSSIRDFSFKEYSSRKTFRTILALYRTRFFANEEIELLFDTGRVTTKTDASGSFFIQTNSISPLSKLSGICLSSGQQVKLIEGLYSYDTHHVHSTDILVSDIDDTLLHSFISNKLLKLRTLMFTSLEKRRAVTEMMKVVQDFYKAGIQPFYLSNSEQNLYPVIYRFLRNNDFPKGPLFLKQMRLLRDVFGKRNILLRDIHKLTTLEKLIRFFPGKQFILVGDNTQHDLMIYTTTAQKFPTQVRLVIIREVKEKAIDESFGNAFKTLKELNIPFYYDASFPNGFDLAK